MRQPPVHLGYGRVDGGRVAGPLDPEQRGAERPSLPDDHRLRDAGDPTEHGLDLRGLEVLPVRGLQQVLLAPVDDESAVTGDVAEIARLEPAIAERLLVLLDVAGHHLRSPHLELAIVGDPDLCLGQQLAGRPDAVPAQAVQRHERGLGEPVRLVNLHAELVEGPQQLFVDGCRADEQLRAAIQAGPAEHRATNRRSEDQSEGSRPHPLVPRSDPAASDPLPDLLVQAGHGEEDGWTNGRQGRGHPSEVLQERDLDGRGQVVRAVGPEDALDHVAHR